MTEPEESRDKTPKTDQVLSSPDGDPHHTLAQGHQPDEHLPVTFTHDDRTDVVDDDEQ